MTRPIKICKLLLIGSIFPGGVNCAPNEKPAAPSNRSTTKPDLATLTEPVFEDLDRFHRIVFLMDPSGSMINSMPSLKDQTVKAVNDLSAAQFFNVIVFTSGPLSAELLAPSEKNKRWLRRFLDRVPIEATDPIPALYAAFKQNPDVIYLVTDGDFPENEPVLQTFRKLNEERKAKVKIYTIAFVRGGDGDETSFDILKHIAGEGGGRYKRVSAKNL